MKKGVTVSLIIATYNWPEALRLCLNSILKQTILPSEIVIADDGSDERTAKLIHDFAQKVSFPIFHEWHEDKGFRKTIVLNRAIRKVSASYIIQIDGDIVTSPHFIEEHPVTLAIARAAADIMITQFLFFITSSPSCFPFVFAFLLHFFFYLLHF